MRLCVIGLRGAPNVMGGIETHCENLYPELKRLDDSLDITIIARRGYAPAAEFAGVRVRPLWAPRGKGVETLVHTPLALIYARLFIHPDIVHLHGVGPSFFAPMARVLGFRTICTHHGADYERPKWRLAGRAFLRAGEQMMARFADEIVCVSEGGARRVRALAKRAARHSEVIRNGAPPPPPEAHADKQILDRLGLRPKAYILTVGRIDPTKRFQDLIAAFKKATPRGQKLVIVGASQTDDLYARALQAQACESIVFAGYQNAATLRLLYQNAALFVLASCIEGSPLVALEAMSAGAPVLLSNIEANEEFGLEPHNYFRVRDVSALAQKLSADSYDIYRSACAASILRESTWDEIARRHLRLLRRISARPAHFTEADAFAWARSLGGRRAPARASAARKTRERA